MAYMLENGLDVAGVLRVLLSFVAGLVVAGVIR